jgi:hypothetical protein
MLYYKTISSRVLIDFVFKVGVLKYLRRALRFPNATKVYPSDILESGKPTFLTLKKQREHTLMHVIFTGHGIQLKLVNICN